MTSSVTDRSELVSPLVLQIIVDYASTSTLPPNQGVERIAPLWILHSCLRTCAVRSGMRMELKGCFKGAPFSPF